MSATEPRRRRATVTGCTPRRLTKLELGEVSLVDIPANQGARHIFNKTEDPADAARGDLAGDEVAELRRQIAAAEAGRVAAETVAAAANAGRDELEGMLAALADVAVPAAPALVEPSTPAASPPPPARTPYEDQDAQLGGLAIMAREYPDKAGRAYWRQQIDVLGRHLLPESSAREQLSAALDDERGRAFVVALQSRPA